MDKQSFVSGVVGGAAGALCSRMVRQRYGDRGWWVFAVVAFTAAAGAIFIITR